MHTPRLRRFHRVCHRGQIGSAPRRATAPAAATWARRQLGRFLLCVVLLLAGSGPVWSVGKTLAGLYRDEQVRRSPLAVAKSTPRALPRPGIAASAATPASLLLPSNGDGSLSGANEGEAFLEDISLELANPCLPTEGQPLSLFASSAPEGCLADVAGSAVPPIDTESAAGALFTGTVDAYQAAVVPEPAAWACLALGVAGTLVAAIRRRLR